MSLPLETPLQLHWAQVSRELLVSLASVLLAFASPTVGVNDEVGLGQEAILSPLSKNFQTQGHIAKQLSECFLK